MKIAQSLVLRLFVRPAIKQGASKLQFRFIHIVVTFCWVLNSSVTAFAGSSSPLLAAYYDRQMAIAGGRTYYWNGSGKPKELPLQASAVGVGRNHYYALTPKGDLVRFRSNPQRGVVLMPGVVRFAAGRSGVLITARDDTLWWIAKGSDTKQRIADGVVAAAVGDGANYYISEAGALFVKGKAHRGQYGDGRLEPADQFVQTSKNVKQITAHTGHAILLTHGGDVLGTGGNIYGPVGKHGLGDKAIRWSRIVSDVQAIATGASHSVAIRHDGTLLSWGSEYGPEPVVVMTNIHAVAAGSHTTIALMEDGSLWQWNRGQEPWRHNLPN